MDSAPPLFSILCGIQGCPVRLTAANNRDLTAMQWHHMVGVHHPDLYAKLGFPVEKAQ